MGKKALNHMHHSTARACLFLQGAQDVFIHHETNEEHEK